MTYVASYFTESGVYHIQFDINVLVTARFHTKAHSFKNLVKQSVSLSTTSLVSGLFSGRNCYEQISTSLYQLNFVTTYTHPTLQDFPCLFHGFLQCIIRLKYISHFCNANLRHCTSLHGKYIGIICMQLCGKIHVLAVVYIFIKFTIQKFDRVVQNSDEL